jgi:hypothetical protein
VGVGLKDLVCRYYRQISKEEQTGFEYRVPLTQAQKRYVANDLRYLPVIYKQQQAKITLFGLENTIGIEMKVLPAMVWLVSNRLYFIGHPKAHEHILSICILKLLCYCPFYLFYHTSSTAIRPLKKTPSKVPAPPMLTIGAPRSRILFRFIRSAPISVPRVPPT